MKKLFALVAIVLGVLVAAGTAYAGCMATVGLGSTPSSDLAPGQAWFVKSASCSMAGRRCRTRGRRSGFGGRTASSWSSRRRPRRRSARTARGWSSREPVATRSASTTGFRSRSARECTRSTAVVDSRSVVTADVGRPFSASAARRAGAPTRPRGSRRRRSPISGFVCSLGSFRMDVCACSSIVRQRPSPSLRGIP